MAIKFSLSSTSSNRGYAKLDAVHQRVLSYGFAALFAALSCCLFALAGTIVTGAGRTDEPVRGTLVLLCLGLTLAFAARFAWSSARYNGPVHTTPQGQREAVIRGMQFAGVA